MSRYKVEIGAFAYVTEDGQTFAIAEDANAAQKIVDALNSMPVVLEALASCVARLEAVDADRFLERDLGRGALKMARCTCASPKCRLPHREFAGMVSR